MKLYILRHGDAGERDPANYTSDAMRALTAKGIKRTRQLANALRQMEITFDLILSSPLIRAKQTAEIVARSLEIEKKLRLASELAPDHGIPEVIRLLQGATPKCETLLIVGHEPGLSRLISQLCTGGTSLPLTLKKGGLCRLEVNAVGAGACATLEWLLSPRHFGPKRKTRAG